MWVWIFSPLEIWSVDKGVWLSPLPPPYISPPAPRLPPPFWSGARFARSKISFFPSLPFFLPSPSSRPSSPSSLPIFSLLPPLFSLLPPPLLPLPPPNLPLPPPHLPLPLTLSAPSDIRFCVLLQINEGSRSSIHSFSTKHIALHDLSSSSNSPRRLGYRYMCKHQTQHYKSIKLIVYVKINTLVKELLTRGGHWGSEN